MPLPTRMKMEVLLRQVLVEIDEQLRRVLVEREVLLRKVLVEECRYRRG